MSKPRLLVLYANYAEWCKYLGYLLDWRDAFEQHPSADTVCYDVCNPDHHAGIRRRASDCDLVILLHSVNADAIAPFELTLLLVEDRRAPLVVFVGNELSMPTIGLEPKLAWIRRLSPSFIATQLPLESARYLYQDIEEARVLAIPHALNPSVYKPRVPVADREKDIVVRSAKYLCFYGDDDRLAIMDYFESHAEDLGLRVDISGGRFDRDGWAAFLGSARATVATEAGATYLEPDDRTMKAILRFTRRRYGRGWQALYNRLRGGSPPETGISRLDRRIRRVRKRLLEFLDSEERRRVFDSLRSDGGGDLVDPDEIFRRFFSDGKPRVSGKAISSRHFEAIGTRTIQVMFPGRFNDILTPDEHYFSLRRDFGNVREIIERIRDIDAVERTTGRTLEYVLDAHTHRHRIDALLSEAGLG